MNIPTSTLVLSTLSEQVNTLNITFGEINHTLKEIHASLGPYSFFNSQLFAAIIGVCFGSLLPLFYKLFSDRPRITVKIAHSLVSISTNVSSALSIEIQNSGRRPINVTSLLLEFADKTVLCFLDSSFFVTGGSGLPIKLEEHSSHSTAIWANALQRPIHEKGSYPRWAIYKDALGNVYKRKFKRKFWINLLAQR